MVEDSRSAHSEIFPVNSKKTDSRKNPEWTTFGISQPHSRNETQNRKTWSEFSTRQTEIFLFHREKGIPFRFQNKWLRTKQKLSVAWKIIFVKAWGISIAPVYNGKTGAGRCNFSHCLQSNSRLFQNSGHSGRSFVATTSRKNKLATCGQIYLTIKYLAMKRLLRKSFLGRLAFDWAQLSVWPTKLQVNECQSRNYIRVATDTFKFASKTKLIPWMDTGSNACDQRTSRSPHLAITFDPPRVKVYRNETQHAGVTENAVICRRHFQHEKCGKETEL